MAEEIVRPVYKQSNTPWLIMLLMLPLFFLFGWVANEAYEGSRISGLDVGVGGGPEVTEQGPRGDIVSPTPDSMIEATPTVTASPSPTPTEGENDNVVEDLINPNEN